ncbi:MAG: hypothetical protein AAB467_00835 [Patescibacteria group bacterium]
MSGTLSAEDAAWISAAREARVLEHIREKNPQFKDGVIPMFCPDADRTEMRKHLDKLVARETDGKPPRVHPLTSHGAALALPWQSPLSNLSPFLFGFLTDRRVFRNWFWRAFIYITFPLWWIVGRVARIDIFFLIKFWWAIDHKGIKAVVLYIHAPCGAAGQCGISFLEQLRYLILAKRRLKRRLELLGITVTCLCHVDYGNTADGYSGDEKEHPNTYFIRTHKAEAWLEHLSQRKKNP